MLSFVCSVSGQVLRCDVFVDAIVRIEITTRTRELLLEEEPERFELRAFDNEGGGRGASGNEGGGGLVTMKVGGQVAMKVGGGQVAMTIGGGGGASGNEGGGQMAMKVGGGQVAMKVGGQVAMKVGGKWQRRWGGKWNLSVHGVMVIEGHLKVGIMFSRWMFA